MRTDETEQRQLQAVALKNAESILAARQRAERELLAAKEALEKKTEELLRAEQEARENSWRLQLALDAGALGDWTWDAITDRVTLSARAAEILRMPSDFRGTMEQLDDHIAAADRESAQEAFEQALASRADYSVEFRVVRDANRVRWVASRGRPFYSDTGALLGMSGVVQDVSEHKSADEARSRLVEVVASSDDAIITKTLDGVITSWNQGAERIFGYGADEAIGRPVTMLIPDDHIDEEPAILARLRRGERIEHYETIRRRKDGMLLNISLSVSPLRDARGKVVGASKIARDITERKRAEEALRATESRFRQMADSAPVMVWISDTTKACTWFNKARLDFTGRPMDQELGFGWIQNVHQDDLDRILKIYAEKFEARASFQMEYRLARRNGEWRWVIEHAIPLFEGPDQKFSGYIGSCLDITEFREAAAERERLLESERAARTEAERLGRLKDEFLATLSHELRTPLNAILGWATLMRRIQVGSDDHVKGLETIERNARVQSQLIADLLDMSRIISGKVQLDVQPLALHEVISAAIDSVRPSAEGKRVRLRATLDAKVGRLRGDANRLQQVFWNLLTNAVKFTPAGGRIDVLLERVNSHVEISVEDSGIGIKPEFLAFVFDRFRQADASITRRQGGLGLGLSIVKHLVELHGGTVRVKSAGEGHGTTFIVALPISVARAEDSGIHERPAFADVDLFSLDLPSLSGVTVLVVDDEADSRLLTARLVEDRGARAVVAGTAAETLRLLAAEPVDILVSDIGMPDGDGYELMRTIRSRHGEQVRHIPAIALTAYARTEDRQRALLAGYQMHLSKPIEPRELIAGIATLLNLPHARVRDK